MHKFIKQKKYLQLISQIEHEAARRRKLDRKMYYPEILIEPEAWYTHSIEDSFGKVYTMRLLNRPGERNDSYFVEFNGDRVYFNRFGNMVLNQTRVPLILGFYNSMMFFAKQFPKISGRHDE
jgi:hypothetical protein